MNIKYSAKEFMGKRELLEDRTLSATLKTKGGMNLTVVAVADGMGGEGKGQRASTLALDVLRKTIEVQEDHNPVTALEAAFVAANDAVTREVDETPGLSGMGTTLAVAVVEDGKLFIANAGDSRIYLVRKGELRQISRDHTLETKMRLKGRDEAYINSNRNKSKLTNHIGTPEKFYVDLGLYLDQSSSTEQAEKNQGLDLQEGDKVVLCSDGLVKNTKTLTQAVENKEIVSYVGAYEPEMAAKKLGDLAVSREVSDNVSVAIIDTGGKRTKPPVKRSNKWVYAAGGLLALAAIGFLAFRGQQPAAIPDLPDNQAFASDVRGIVQFNPSGKLDPQPVSRGDIFVAGEAATLEVIGEGYLRLGLADNSIISLGDNTKIELRQISNDSGATETQIVLIRGKLLVNADIPADRDFLVFGDNGAVARVEGTVMGVFYDAGGQQFLVDCLEGHCVIIDANGNEVELSQGELAELFGFGEISDKQPSRYDFWLDIADKGLIFTPTPQPSDAPTSTPSRTPVVSTSGNSEQQKATATEERPTPYPGCTDSRALNYSRFATTDDGSCKYPVYGCTDSGALNYNSKATNDDGSCKYPVYGCTDSGALNYNSKATNDDGSCKYPVYGCTDPGASNFNSNATNDDGSCQYPVYGCTDPNADNYDPNATDDDGSCTYPQPVTYHKIAGDGSCSAKDFTNNPGGDWIEGPCP
jgi:serine/threonine protein phosphatase PrpC